MENGVIYRDIAVHFIQDELLFVGIAFAAQLAALFLPGFRQLFGTPLSFGDFGISITTRQPVIETLNLRGRL